MTSAEEGNIFALTENGYRETPNHVKHERAIGWPVKGYEHDAPTSWIEKGYVEEVAETCRGREEKIRRNNVDGQMELSDFIGY